MTRTVNSCIDNGLQNHRSQLLLGIMHERATNFIFTFRELTRDSRVANNSSGNSLVHGQAERVKTMGGA
jgi:hypothetical protein